MLPGQSTEPKHGDDMRYLFCILIALFLAGDSGAGQIFRGSTTGGGGGYATPAYVNSVSSYTYTYDTPTTITGVTSGNVLVMFIAGSNSQTVTSVSTTSGSTSAWTLLGTGNGNSAGVYIYWCYATASGNVSATPAGSPSDAGVVIHEYSGVETVSPQEGTFQGDTGTDAAFATASVTTTTTNALLVGVWSSETADRTITYGSGWTQRINETNHIHKTADKIVTATGSYNFSGTMNSDTSHYAGFAVLKAKAL